MDTWIFRKVMIQPLTNQGKYCSDVIQEPLSLPLRTFQFMVLYEIIFDKLCLKVFSQLKPPRTVFFSLLQCSPLSHYGVFFSTYTFFCSYFEILGRINILDAQPLSLIKLFSESNLMIWIMNPGFTQW